jgi:hypothetical protein
VQIQKAQKIDQQQTYPCPCRRKARLNPIVLTDAFGCDRCSLIFVVEDNGYSLVQLGGIDPYRRAWQWIGTKWQATKNMGSKYPLEFPLRLMLKAIVIVLIGVIAIWLVAAFIQAII